MGEICIYMYAYMYLCMHVGIYLSICLERDEDRPRPRHTLCPEGKSVEIAWLKAQSDTAGRRDGHLKDYVWSSSSLRATLGLLPWSVPLGLWRTKRWDLLMALNSPFTTLGFPPCFVIRELAVWLGDLARNWYLPCLWTKQRTAWHVPRAEATLEMVETRLVS